VWSGIIPKYRLMIQLINQCVCKTAQVAAEGGTWRGDIRDRRGGQRTAHGTVGRRDERQFGDAGADGATAGRDHDDTARADGRHGAAGGRGPCTQGKYDIRHSSEPSLSKITTYYF
jgi:hypothetical protein